MILEDYSSVFHRCVFTAGKALMEQGEMPDENGKLDSVALSRLAMTFMLNDFKTTKSQHEAKFGQYVLCFDTSSSEGWRRDLYPLYKMNRTNKVSESNVDWNLVFEEFKPFEDFLFTKTDIKCLRVPKAEADDIILVLAQIFGPLEPTLIKSPDKDFIQAQRHSDNIKQYSPLTKKWMDASTKAEDMEHWITEHVFLGDGSDGVPKVVDGVEFSEAFNQYIVDNGYEPLEPFEFYQKYTIEKCYELILAFDVFKLNRKGEPTPNKDIFKDVRFGPSTLKKSIDKFGSLQEFLKSHPLYEDHFRRNYALVMDLGIPEDIRKQIEESYANAETSCNIADVNIFMNEMGLTKSMNAADSLFSPNEKRELTADDFDW